MDNLLRLPEVAEVTGLPENTLRFWRHQGTGPRSMRRGAGWSTGNVTSSTGSANSSKLGDETSARSGRHVLTLQGRVLAFAQKDVVVRGGCGRGGQCGAGPPSPFGGQPRRHRIQAVVGLAARRQ